MRASHPQKSWKKALVEEKRSLESQTVTHTCVHTHTHPSYSNLSPSSDSEATDAVLRTLSLGSTDLYADIRKQNGFRLEMTTYGLLHDKPLGQGASVSSAICWWVAAAGIPDLWTDTEEGADRERKDKLATETHDRNKTKCLKGTDVNLGKGTREKERGRERQKETGRCEGGLEEREGKRIWEFRGLEYTVETQINDMDDQVDGLAKAQSKYSNRTHSIQRSWDKISLGWDCKKSGLDLLYGLPKTPVTVANSEERRFRSHDFQTLILMVAFSLSIIPNLGNFSLFSLPWASKLLMLLYQP